MKTLARDLDDNIDKFINYEGRADFRFQLKRLPGFENRGLKRADRIRSALSCCADPEDDKVLKEHDKAKETWVSWRTTARLQISCRSACLIIQRNRSWDIQNFFAEASALGIKGKLPAQIKARLDAMKQGGVAAEDEAD